MIIYPKTPKLQNAMDLIGHWRGSPVPIFYVHSMHALNQLVGYVKHINSGNGTVLYRGQCELYDKMAPNILHQNNADLHKQNNELLNEAIQKIQTDPPLMKFFNFDEETSGWDLYQRLIIEATFQHYGAKTYCIDFVDNHWTALWFGVNRWNIGDNRYDLRGDVETDSGNHFINFDDNYTLKTLPPEPTLQTTQLTTRLLEKIQKDASGSISFEELYDIHQKNNFKREHKKWESVCKKIENFNEVYNQNESAAHMYLFLYVAETNANCIHGLYLGENTYTIDLRKALPSTFLRPCSQHGWIVRSKKDDFSFNSNVACIIRIDVKLVKELLGSGALLSQDNFFPSYEIDNGYHVLLERQINSILKSNNTKIIPENFIKTY